MTAVSEARGGLGACCASMADLIEVLMEEHLHVLMVLNAVERVRGAGPGQPPTHLDVLEAAVEFLRVQVDGAHHGKEEAGLFAAMEAAGLPPSATPVGCMLHQHVRGRELTESMARAIDGARRGDADAQEALRLSAGEYVRVLAPHIQMEDYVVYPLARRAISADALARLGERLVDPAELAAFADAARAIDAAASRAP
ncbi:MAG: hemerythrin domain-containing protein [Polyangiaceae bacterium]|nr:hemerythrin domain-containing protein [Polyangiaceae bacterium]